MDDQNRMEIIILGSGTCVPSLTRHPCSILVKGPSIRILVDLGPGIMGQLLKAGVEINDIDMILLSHFHLDHSAELAPFIFATKYPGFERRKKLTLAGGTGIRKLYRGLNAAFGGSLDMPEDLFGIVELEEHGRFTAEPDGIRLDVCPVVHKKESRAFRFTDATGFSFVYSGDTDVSEALVTLSKGADLLICESALPDGEKVPGHLTPSLAGRMAAEAGVKKLVLTHFYPECDPVDIEAQARQVFKGPVVLARDLLNLSTLI